MAIICTYVLDDSSLPVLELNPRSMGCIERGELSVVTSIVKGAGRGRFPNVKGSFERMTSNSGQIKRFTVLEKR